MGLWPRLDDRSTIRDVVQVVNAMVGGMSGLASDGKQWSNTRFDGAIPSVNGSTATSNNYSQLLRSTVGNHRATLLAATSPTAAPTPANSVVLETDAGLSIGAGKAHRLYGPGGTVYGEFTAADSGVVTFSGVGGVAPGQLHAAALYATKNIGFYSDTGFVITLDHAATANHTLTVQDLDGTVALLGAANAGHLVFADNLYDIGASGATRPRDLFLSRTATIGGLGTASRILGDLSNATHANRLLIQNSTANSPSVLGLMSSGTGTTAALNIYALSNPDASSIMQVLASSTAVSLTSTATGGATVQRLNIMHGTNIRFSADGTGISFFNSAPIAQTALPAAAADLPTVITLANGIRTRLINFGLTT